MFLKNLKISKADGSIIRDINFHLGLNLIIDETPFVDGKETGNNVGKTTVLKLIDFCLGGDAKSIYTDTENQRNEYKLIKDFLIDNNVTISLTIKEDLAISSSPEYVLERNFLSRKNKILKINENILNEKDYEKELTEIMYPGHYNSKPTFRQIISHNIRYNDLSLNNTLKVLNHFTTDEEYETLYLFLFGCKTDKSDTKHELLVKKKIEEKLKNRLEESQTKSAYESSLSIINDEIRELEQKKTEFNVDPNFEEKLEQLNEIKYSINIVSSEINKLKLRRSLILEAQEDLKQGFSKIDLKQLKTIYEQATSIIGNLHKTFEELYDFHNNMIVEKTKFITKDLSVIEPEIVKKDIELKNLLANEAELTKIIIKGDSFNNLEELIVSLNQKYQRKGELETVIKQLNSVEERLISINNDLDEIDSELYSKDFSDKVKEQINKFNKFFSMVSNEVYGEKYALKADHKETRKGKFYEFSAFNTNFSSGKKQGEISCFDIAYILFADNEGIPCLHFLLNDRKELMHDNQLIKISEFVNSKKIQFVASILKDKLPSVLNKEEFFLIKLTPTDKLFRV